MYDSMCWFAASQEAKEQLQHVSYIKPQGYSLENEFMHIRGKKILARVSSAAKLNNFHILCGRQIKANPNIQGSNMLLRFYFVVEKARRNVRL